MSYFWYNTYIDCFLGFAMKHKIVKFFINLKMLFIQLGWLLAIVIPLFVFINWAIFTIVDTQKDTIKERLYISAEKELQNIDLFVNTRLTFVHDDIHVIENADETHLYLEDPTHVNTESYQQLIYRIALSKPSFINMMMMDVNGDILYQVSRDEDEQAVVVTGTLGSLYNALHFSVIESMDTSKTYLSELYLKDGKPILTFVKPMVYNDVLQSYLVIDYDANDLTSVLELYTTDEEDYFEFGFMNDAAIWLVNDTSFSLMRNEDLAYRENLLDKILQNSEVVVKYFSFDNEDHHFFVEQTNSLRFYIMLDINAAINDSESVFIRNAQWIAVSTNLIAGVLISFIAYMLSVRKDDRLLINANMYLTVQNEDSIVIIDKSLRIIYINPAFEKMFGYHLKDIYLKKIVPTIGVPYLPLRFDFKKIKEYDDHTWHMTKSGIYLLLYLRVKQEASIVGRNKHFIGIHSNSQIVLDDYKLYAKNTSFTMDPLFRLFETLPFDEQQSTMFFIKTMETDTYHFADFIKKHVKSDYVITVLKSNFVLIYARIKHDQFIHAVTHIDNLIETYSSLPDISNNFSRTFVVARASHTLSRINLLIEAALVSMSYAKERKHVRYFIYSEKIKQHVIRDYHIEKELSKGFKEHEFYLEYQVVKDVKQNRFIGAEALLRWHNKHLGQVSPAEFLPVIENSIYINKLSLMVLSIAIFDFEQMVSEFNEDFKISINLSQFDLNNDYIIEQMMFKINQSNLTPAHFVFEMTENQIINNLERTKQTIDELHRHGIEVAVDDFGTGYTSIHLLKSINADYIKIDKQYIKNYPSEDNGRMLDTFIDLIHRFDKPIVIEGVETKAHIDYCVKHHCEYAQGYYIARPMNAESFKEKFKQTKGVK